MNEMPAHDPYWGMAEFHDLFMDVAWRQVGPVLVDAFGDLPSDAVVIDLGAGSGIGTRVLAQSTAAQIVAVEPSLMMRAMLITRVADDPVLSERVTVVADAVPGVLDRVDQPIDGFVCAHVLGHLSVPDRVGTWSGLARRLTDQATGVVVVNSDAYSTSADDVVPAERRIGEHRYVERHLSAEGGRYASEYTVFHGDKVVRRELFTGDWESITVESLAHDVAPHGLTVEHCGDGIGLIRRIRATANPS